MRSSGIVSYVLDNIGNDVQLFPLPVDQVGDVSEQLIQLTHRLFNVPNFRFSFDDKRLLEVDLVL